MILKSTGWIRVGAVATVCALAGAGAGIAGSSAATSGKSTTTKKNGTARTAPAGRPGGPGPGPGFGHFRGGPPVHEESVVLDKAGKAFITLTRDNGTVKSVSGNDIVITEGTKTVTYKDVTVSIPSGATITRNGKKATLADLKAGDHVMVSSSSDGTEVFAADDTFKPAGPFGRGHGHGPGGPGGPAGAPPAPPAGTPGTYPGTP